MRPVFIPISLSVRDPKTSETMFYERYINANDIVEFYRIESTGVTCVVMKEPVLRYFVREKPAEIAASIREG